MSTGLRCGVFSCSRIVPREGWNVGVAASTLGSVAEDREPRSKPVGRLGLPIGVVLEGSEVGLKIGGNLNAPGGGVVVAVCGAAGGAVAERPTLLSVEGVDSVVENGVVD